MNKSSPGSVPESKTVPAVLSGTILSEGARLTPIELSEQIAKACSEYERVVKIDCSAVDCGGTVLRTAVALSAVTGIPVHLTSLHSSEDKPGMVQSHVSTMSLFSALHPSSTMFGNYVGSTELFFATAPFTPSSIRSVSPCFVGSSSPSRGSSTAPPIPADNTVVLRHRADSLIKPSASTSAGRPLVPED